jgi:DNA modification methylase
LYWRWNGMIRKGREDRVHPTQKPLGVMQWAITQLPDKANTICDPYMGSGTTGVACAKLGRKFVGIEIDAGYFDIAVRRIEEAYRQPDMFTQPAAPKAEQLDIGGLE